MRVHESAWLGTNLTVASYRTGHVVEADFNLAGVGESKSDKCKFRRSILCYQSWLDIDQVRIVVAVCFVVTCIVNTVESDLDPENIRFSVLWNGANDAVRADKSAWYNNFVLHVVEELDKKL